MAPPTPATTLQAEHKVLAYRPYRVRDLSARRLLAIVEDDLAAADDDLEEAVLRELAQDCRRAARRSWGERGRGR